MFDRNQSAGYMFNLCARAFERRSAELLGPLGVTPAYLPVLFYIVGARQKHTGGVGGTGEY
ncbi:hypothetical protein [Arthrobacter sp. SD76]|uniref:hypothetical protein n=1 Tax=Arthrobacter sp. SD76 TaxID=3415007 RepID=UPI003C7265E3